MAFPSPALDHQEESLSLDKLLLIRPHSTFMMEAATAAMLQAGIFPGTRLLVDRSVHPQNGDIVIAVVNGEHQVRFLKKNPHKSWLCPANRTMRDVEITPDMQVEIWGVVTCIFTEPKMIRHVFFG